MKLLLALLLTSVLLYLCHIAKHPKCPNCKTGRGYQHGLWPKEICNWCGHEWDRFAPRLPWQIIVVALLLTSCVGCTGPRYDYNGNGTSFCDRAAMSLGKVINKQRPPSRFEHSPEEYRTK